MIVEDAPADDAWEQRFHAVVAAERQADRQGAVNVVEPGSSCWSSMTADPS